MPLAMQSISFCINENFWYAVFFSVAYIINACVETNDSKNSRAEIQREDAGTIDIQGSASSL
jgi:hypothetical protein